MYSTIWVFFYRIQIKSFLITWGESGHHHLFIHCFTPFNWSTAAFIPYPDGDILHINCRRRREHWPNTSSKHCGRGDMYRSWDKSDDFEAFHRINNCLRLENIFLSMMNLIGNAWWMISETDWFIKKTLHVKWPSRGSRRFFVTWHVKLDLLFAAFVS